MEAPKIKRSNLPVTYPANGTAIAYLLLDKFQAPGWVWGAVFSLVALVWIVAIGVVMNSRDVDLLQGK